MDKLIFEDETIWLDGEIIGGYSYKDENSGFEPTKEKVWWGYIREHELQCDDYTFYAKSVSELKSRIAKYLKNKEAGIKDLPQITEQISRIINSATKYAGEKFGYYTKKSSEYLENVHKRLNLVEEFKKRGFWWYGEQIVPRWYYEILK